MTTASGTQCVTDAGYSAMLARFNQQPVRLSPSVPTAPEAATIRRKPFRRPDAARPARTSLPEASSAAAQLRVMWTQYTVLNNAPGHSISEAAGDWKDVYLAWRDACRQKFLSPLMCIEVVCLGINVDEADARYKMKHGTSKDNALHCLEIYASLHAGESAK